jgi:G3E family GTPase
MRGKDILRVKGIVFIEGVEKPFVFHGVQDIFDPPVRLEDWPKTDSQSRIVIIGRDLSDSQLQSTLDMLRAPPDDKAPNFKFINP